MNAPCSFICQKVIRAHKAGDEMHDFRCLVLARVQKGSSETCLQIYKINNALVHGKIVGFAEM